MSLVGSFPGLGDVNRRTIRAPVNPMDKTTVVSIFPKLIDERKHTIQPGRFVIAPGNYENPSILVVGPSSWWREIDYQQPLLEIPNGSVQVADSIVKDYCNGLLACDLGTSMPGLFYIPGEFTIVKLKTDPLIKENFQGYLDVAAGKQRNWYTELVKMADSLWARTNGSPLCISDDMRLAARELNLTGKDWMKDFTMLQQIRCAACGSPRNPLYPVCPSCKAIDQTNPLAKTLKFAE